MFDRKRTDTVIYKFARNSFALTCQKPGFFDILQRQCEKVTMEKKKIRISSFPRTED